MGFRHGSQGLRPFRQEDSCLTIIFLEPNDIVYGRVFQMTFLNFEEKILQKLVSESLHLVFLTYRNVDSAVDIQSWTLSDFKTILSHSCLPHRWHCGKFRDLQIISRLNFRSSTNVFLHPFHELCRSVFIIFILPAVRLGKRRRQRGRKGEAGLVVLVFRTKICSCASRLNLIFVGFSSSISSVSLSPAKLFFFRSVIYSLGLPWRQSLLVRLSRDCRHSWTDSLSNRLTPLLIFMFNVIFINSWKLRNKNFLQTPLNPSTNLHNAHEQEKC